MSFDRQFQPAKGNRQSLSFDERDILENKILPTARRWAAEMPALRSSAEGTLNYWGEMVPAPRAERRGDAA